MEPIYSPQQVADMLGLSTSMVRKYSQAYEKFRGRLPRDNRNGRLYSQEHMEVFKEVNDRIRDGQTLEEAMLTVAAPVDSELPAETILTAGASEALELLRQLVAKVESLETEVKALKSLPAADDQSERIAALEHRNHYLTEELRRRDEQNTQEQRPWWRLWQRKKPTLGGG